MSTSYLFLGIFVSQMSSSHSDLHSTILHPFLFPVQIHTIIMQSVLIYETELFRWVQTIMQRVKLFIPLSLYLSEVHTISSGHCPQIHSFPAPFSDHISCELKIYVYIYIYIKFLTSLDILHTQRRSTHYIFLSV